MWPKGEGESGVMTARHQWFKSPSEVFVLGDLESQSLSVEMACERIGGASKQVAAAVSDRPCTNEWYNDKTRARAAQKRNRKREWARRR